MLNPPVNGKIQGLYKAFECFSSTFQGKFYFQGLFKTVLYIKVLFKPVRTLYFDVPTHLKQLFGSVMYRKDVSDVVLTQLFLILGISVITHINPMEYL